MTIRNRLIISTIVSIGLVCILALLLHSSFRQMAEEAEKQARANELVQQMTDLIIVTEEYLAFHYPRAEQQWHAKYNEILNFLEQEPVLLASVRPELEEQARLFSQIKSNYQQREILYKSSGAAEEINRNIILEERLATRMRLTSRKIMWLAFNIFNTAHANVAVITNWNTVVIMSYVIFMVAAVLVNAYFTLKSVTPPLNELIRGAARIEQGDLTHTFDPTGKKSRIRPDDEIGELAVAFNSMTRKLVSSLGKLELEIEGRRRIEEALRASEKKFRSYIASAPNGIFVADEKGDYVEINEAAEAITGYSHAELLKMKLIDLIAPEDHHKAWEHFETVAQTGKASGDFSFIKKDDGSLNYWTVDAVQLSPTRLLAFVTDITKRKQAEVELRQHRDSLEDLVALRTSELDARVVEAEQLNSAMTNLLEDLQSANRNLKATTVRLEEVNQELEDFAYVISHDLKAPLRGISQLSTWIEDDYTDVLDDEGKHKLHLLTDRVKRMHALIDGVLQYSRAGRSGEQIRPVNLNQLARDVIELLAPPAHIRVSVEDELPLVVGEATRLTQVFQNLVDNGIKFMDKSEGTVTIGCTDEGERWRFRVSDNGPGIEQRHYDRIFRLFQMLASQASSASTGVGLALVKRIIERSGGQVWVESAVGKGTTFSFTLPKREISL